MQTISDAGVRFIAAWEGFRSHWYLDVGGKPTIGYGHLIRPGESFGELTEDEGLALLRKDIAIAEAGVRAAFPGVALTQEQFDALVSFAFNLGVGMLGHTHTLGDAIRAGDFAGAAAAFVLYDHVNCVENAGLKNRRLAERDMFLRPDVA